MITRIKIKYFGIGLVILVGILTFSFGVRKTEAYDVPSWQILARVNLVNKKVNELDLPVYKHLQDAQGIDYVLVVASSLQLEESGEEYEIILYLDSIEDIKNYILAFEIRAGAIKEAAAVVDILMNDGRYIIVKGNQKQAELLSSMGFTISWFAETPMVFKKARLKSTTIVDGQYNQIIADMLKQVDSQKLNNYLGNLSGAWPVMIDGANYTVKTRYTGSGIPIEKATQYVYNFMESKGLEVSCEKWEKKGYTNKNVIGQKVGETKQDEIVIIGAHVDSILMDGPMRSESQAVAPGCDDNASGSVLVMTAVEILSQYDFERTIKFVFFTGEEQGMLGSDTYVNNLCKSGEAGKIIGFYNADMISRLLPALQQPEVEMHTRLHSDDAYIDDMAIANIFVDVVQTYSSEDAFDDYGISINLIPIIIESDGFSLSDQVPFWGKAIPATLINERYHMLNFTYHRSNDTLDKVNLTS